MINQTLRDRAVKAETKDLADLVNRELVPTARQTRAEVNRILSGAQPVSSASGTLVLDWNAQLAYKVTLSEAITIILFKAPTFDRGTFNLLLEQPASSTFTATGWPTNVQWASGSAPTLSTTPGHIDWIQLYFDGTTYAATLVGSGSGGGGGGVTSVFGRVGAVVATAGDYPASKITNDSAVSGAEVSDALNTLNTSISGLVTGVSSVFSRTGAVVATSGDYNGSKITNDSSVSGSTVKDALNTLAAGSGGIGSRALWVPPSVAGGIDDEFSGGVGSALGGSWAWWDDTSASALTPTNGTPSNYTALTGATAPIYRIGDRPDWLRWQLSDQNHVTMLHKGWTPATNSLVWTRIACARMFNSTSQAALNIELEETTSGRPNTANNRVFVGMNVNTVTGLWQINAGAVISGSAQTTVVTSDFVSNNMPEYYGFHKVGTTYYCLAWTEGGQRSYFASFVISATLDRFSYRARTAVTAAPYVTFETDFVRQIDTKDALPM